MFCINLFYEFIMLVKFGQSEELLAGWELKRGTDLLLHLLQRRYRGVYINPRVLRVEHVVT